MDRIIRSIAAFILISTLFTAAAFAEYTVVDAEGKYVLGDLDTKLNARSLALMEAKRIALEKAGTYIESISEVKNSQLTRDQVTSLAAGIMSVETLKEEWKMSGESMVLTLSIRATVDTSNLPSRIADLQNNQDSESSKAMKAKIESLKKELADLKAEQGAIRNKAEIKPEMVARNDNIINKMVALEILQEGLAASRVGNYKEALAAFRRALDSDPNLADAYAGMAIAYQFTEQPDKAIDMANRALMINPKSPISHFAMAKIAFDAGKYDQALDAVNQAIALWPHAPVYYFLRGEIYLKLQKGDSALNDYSRSCTMNHFTACQRVDLLKRRMADGKSGKDLYRTPGLADQQPQTFSEYLEAGHAALLAHNFKEALQAYGSARDMNPRRVEPYTGMTITYLAVRQKDKAYEMANMAMKVAPMSSSANYAMSRYFYEDEKYDKALEYINIAISIYSDTPFFFVHRADIYMKLKDGDKALKDYQKACKMNISWACTRADTVTRQMEEAKTGK
ncbi:MAG: tetratricopeptide repeat protein [Deltaproteobacteria bacterium]